jgi:error-prone DNA polymerase
VYLNCHSQFSFRYGTLKIKELLALAQKNGVTHLALTDINNTSATFDFIRSANKLNIQPIIGIDFRNGSKQEFIGIAKNKEGFKELNDYLSPFLNSKDPIDIPKQAKEFENAYIIYPFEKAGDFPLRENEFLGVGQHHINQLKLSEWRNRQEKLVLLQPVTFRHQKDFNIHRLLRAIDNNTLLSMLPDSEVGRIEETMVSENELKKLFSEFPALLENSKKLLNNCSIEFEEKLRNKKTYTGKDYIDKQLLRKLSEDGFRYRYPNPDETVRARLEKEIKVINDLDFTSYFLINWDICNFANKNGFYYVGRGSGANSIVAYCLYITDVDPIELDLYFERFINPYRSNPPDFDIDFNWTDRDKITEYIFSKHGHEHTALLATYSTFQFRAIVSELGKVFGLPKKEINELAAGKYNASKLDSTAQLVVKYSRLIKGFPNYLSIHAGGIIISEKPMHCYTATHVPPKGYNTTHFSMIEAEDIGLYKFDILSQRGLGKIKDTLDIVRKNQPNAEKIDIHDIARFKEDKAVKELLRTGRAMGCFYVESPGMRMLLTKLQATTYLGLVAASSVIRPGVAQSGMMREYILRFRHPERRKEAHPIMADLMPETYGIMVYQEDVIKVAHYFAGLTLGESDVLRRGMSGKFRSREEFQQVRIKFFQNCEEKGIPLATTSEIWKQIESFAGFAFAKGHSASYAVESYQSLFLKAHYPLEFMVGVINNFGGFYRTEFYIHEARMNGGEIEAPCINRSDFLTTIEDKTIYLGFILMKELQEKVILQFLKERKKNGAYQNLYDFTGRVHISLEQLSLLIRMNAFRSWGKTKKELMWEAHLLHEKDSSNAPSNNLFRIRPKTYELPELHYDKHETAFEELDLLGFTLSDSFELADRENLDSIIAVDLTHHLNKEVTILGQMVNIKNTRTSKGGNMNFGTFLDRNGHFFDTTHFPPSAMKYPFRGKGIYEIKGTVTEEFDFYSIEVDYMKKLPMVLDPRYS